MTARKHREMCDLKSETYQREYVKGYMKGECNA
jgi:hypothetical protein